MTALSVRARHAAISALVRHLPEPTLLSELARRAGVPVPSSEGVESAFAFTSRFVISVGDLRPLVEEASDDLAVALKAALGMPAPSPEEPAVTWVAEPAASAAADAAPRPVGTPATAPPAGGARTWLVKGVEVDAPAAVGPGDSFEATVRLVDPRPGMTTPAPPGHEPYDGLPFDVEIEAWLEEAFPSGDADLHRSVRVDPSRFTECVFELLAADPLPEGVRLGVRFFLSGYEVGRATGRVAVGGGDERQIIPGVIAIPDSILGAGEDAVATVASETIREASEGA